MDYVNEEMGLYSTKNCLAYEDSPTPVRAPVTHIVFAVSCGDSYSPKMGEERHINNKQHKV